ncbi:FUSC family protein [Agromyces endophyticus]|uniref:FUSC family protein n=1 Tax=Agromyces sp. H17E-10 TaxID=2932244 RepID=UPI001FD14FE3|nr:FUSC family protein [Agromyces sp. H17E-10]UOQ90182.1 FUSC family protein [Agromyces sp. H17E-10]
MEVLLGILVAFLIMFVVSVTTIVLVVRAVYRRIRRSRTVADTTLRARAGFSRGPRRKVLALRVRLAETLDSGQAAIDLATGTARPDGRSGRAARGRSTGHVAPAASSHGELPRLFRRIREEGTALDLQLRLLESETDQAVLAAELPAATSRVDQLAGLVRRLRSAVASGLEGATDETLTDLQADLEREVAALAAGVDELRRLNRHDEPLRTPTRPPSRPAASVHRPRSTFDLKETRP